MTDPARADELVRVTLVGAGSMGRAWLSTILRSERALLVGVADVVNGAAQAAVEALVPDTRRSQVLTGTDALTVARDAHAEAVIDVTIPVAHHQVTADALHAGFHVLGEKPCAADLAEALSLAGHAEATGRLFMVSQSRRENPHLRETARLSSELGGAGIVDTRFAKAPHFGGFRDEMAQPLIVDMAIHAFDAARVLTPGRPVTVTATSYNPAWSWYAGDAAATVVTTYDSGAVHTYSGSWCSPGDETSWNGRWCISTANGTVTWDGETPPVSHRAGRSPEGEDTVERGHSPSEDSLWELDSSLDTFCRALRGGPVPPTEVHANIWSQAIVQAAVESADTQRPVAMDTLLNRALISARALDEADGRSSALGSWKDGVTGLSAT
jgi:predicted dehydrogenase